MSTAALRPCTYPGCSAIVEYGRCERHVHLIRKRQSECRPTANALGYTYAWRIARAAYLREHALCVRCEGLQRLTPSQTVDHIVPHRGNQEVFWDQANWQALCLPCHSIKTATHDGGFGNLRKAHA